MDKMGISVIICCYNSAWIIKRTLFNLFNQKGIDSIPYEIILVDNCSNDETSIIVQKCFDENSFLDTSLIFEQQPGLMYAREAGIKKAKYSYLLYCDDDNILSDTYVFSVYDILSKNPQIAACGGYGIPEFENCLKPNWFDDYSKSYAIGKQKQGQYYLYGAGCCFRKEALQNLYKLGFRPLLVGRKKNTLLSGDDAELTMALKCLGYDLYPLDNASFLHVFTEKRLSIDYLCNMFYGFGKAAIVLLVYRLAIEKKAFNCVFFIIFQLCDFIRFIFYKCMPFKLIRAKVFARFCLGRLFSYSLFSFSTLYNQYVFLRKNCNII